MVRGFQDLRPTGYFFMSAVGFFRSSLLLTQSNVIAIRVPFKKIVSIPCLAQKTISQCVLFFIDTNLNLKKKKVFDQH